MARTARRYVAISLFEYGPNGLLRSKSRDMINGSPASLDKKTEKNIKSDCMQEYQWIEAIKLSLLIANLQLWKHL
ncbi:MAG: hypothetical protein ACRC7V_04300 [Lachnospiraceae bacterium]